MLVLGSGETIMDPSFAGMSKETEYNEKRICSECTTRVAIRKCDECKDKFCTICFKETHLTGTRRNHTWKPTGPIDCSDCEMLLAERWCITCDEAFCDPCWRRVHSTGKRRFHPFSEVDIAGKIDARMFTIDGEEVLGGYDASYATKATDRINASAAQSSAMPYTATVQGTAAGQEEWTVYYDDDGAPYWYNNYSQQSQYEDPYAAGY